MYPHCVQFSAPDSDVFNSATLRTELLSSPLDAGMGRAILDALSEISAGIKDLKTEVSDLRGEVKSAKVTNELTAETLMEWRPQLSNEVKAIHDKLEEAEKRYGQRVLEFGQSLVSW